jgi:outer membrane protein
LLGGTWSAVAQAEEATPAGATAAAPLSLAECIRTALQRHPAALAANRGTAAAAAAWRQTRASLYPQVTFGSSYSRFQSTRQGFTVGSPGASENRETSLQLSQLVWDSGLTPSRIRQGQARLWQAQWEETETAQTLAFNVARNFYNVLRSRALLRLNEAIVARAERDVDLAQTAVEVGTGARIDILRAQVPLANARVDLIAARKQAEKDLEALKNAMGLPGTAPLEIAAGPFPAEPTLTLEECRSRAYAQRPELRRLEAALAASREALRAARIQQQPQLSVNGTYEDFFYSSRKVDREWSAGAILSAPLFDGGRTKAAVRAAQAELEAARAQQEQMRQSIDLEVSQAYLDLESARERRQAAQLSVELAQQNLAANQDRYREGVGSLLEVTDAQVELARAETNQIQAEYDFYLAIIALRQAMGERLWEEAP